MIGQNEQTNILLHYPVILSPTATIQPTTTDEPTATPQPTVDTGYDAALLYAGKWKGEWVNATFGSKGPIVFDGCRQLCLRAAGSQAG